MYLVASVGVPCTRSNRRRPRRRGRGSDEIGFSSRIVRSSSTSDSERVNSFSSQVSHVAAESGDAGPVRVDRHLIDRERDSTRARVLEDACPRWGRRTPARRPRRSLRPATRASAVARTKASFMARLRSAHGSSPAESRETSDMRTCSCPAYDAGMSNGWGDGERSGRFAALLALGGAAHGRALGAPSRRPPASPTSRQTASTPGSSSSPPA